ncbi:MAG: adenylate/guanylate cyclase domain-containing protein [Chloroflexi bacterium]|nr:adenylate/guanylate cyclase domain-containing protein [Chloroflexota bacterium]
MDQQIRFCTTSDGVTVAFSVLGEGPPLLCTPGWISHLEMGVAFPPGHEWVEALSSRRQVIRYDGRGTGLSDRRVDDISVEARVRDIEAVADHVGLDSFALFGWSMDGPTAVLYAVRHPERVSHLILYGSFARAFAAEGKEDLARALLALMRAQWSVGSKTVTQFTHPDMDREEAEANAAFFREAASVEVATRILEEGMFESDATEHLRKLKMPVLVMHRRDDNAIGFECGRKLAALIPSARFVALAGSAHPPFYGDTEPVLRAIDDFLGDTRGQTTGVAVGLQTILFTDMEGSTSLTQLLGDARAQELLRIHNSVVREALRAHGGSEIKHTGDGVMASFPSASRALECAIAIQRALAGHNEAHPDSPVRVRVGLNAGEPVAEEADLFGTAVQLAARVCERAQPGEILVSDVVRQLAAGKGFLFSDRGDVVLRGFEDPARLYEVRWEQ